MLDENHLPGRYNQFIVDSFFRLTSEADMEVSGLDFNSFMFYDFALQLFYLPPQNGTRRWYLNEKEFTNAFMDIRFPKKLFAELKTLPTTNYTEKTYQMYTYKRVSNFDGEHEFLDKSNLPTSFLQTEENANEVEERSKHKSLKLKTRKNPSRFVPNKIAGHPSNDTHFYLNFTALRIFDLVDANSDGYVDFYDWGTFYSTLHLFSNFDTYGKGRITAGDAYSKFYSYSDYPRISHTTRMRARKFQQINPDLYVNFYHVYLVLRIEDIIDMYTRHNDKTLLFEVELKRVFNKINLNYINDALLNKCLRGVDPTGIPQYDWECSFMAALIENIHYQESAVQFTTMKAHNITLQNTDFYNTDRTLYDEALRTSEQARAAEALKFS